MWPGTQVNVCLVSVSGVFFRSNLAAASPIFPRHMFRIVVLESVVIVAVVCFCRRAYNLPSATAASSASSIFLALTVAVTSCFELRTAMTYVPVHPGYGPASA
uniref:Uncharacterized protein n=1 Tax=Ixodes ricinus TaxID=34613 RepID=A0A6B0UHL1_IXORI